MLSLSGKRKHRDYVQWHTNHRDQCEILIARKSLRISYKSKSSFRFKFRKLQNHFNNKYVNSLHVNVPVTLRLPIALRTLQ